MLEKVPIAFLAGLLSVITPCVLPLVPGYLSAISAVEVDRLGERGVGRRIVVASLPFIFGFTVIFVLLGGAFAVGAAPCIGTVLASILVLASGSGTIARGIVLLIAYSLGLGAAFVLAGVAFAHAMRAFRWVRDHYAVVQGAS